MAFSNPVYEEEARRAAERVYAGRGGWIGNTYYNPGYTPQGPVVANTSNSPGNDPAAPLRGNVAYSDSGSSGTAASLADPFAPERAKYQNELSKLVSDPSSFFNSGLFKASTDYGIQAINRSAAARKQLTSGNRLAELLKYGQATGAQNYFDQANLLSLLSGATTGSPAAAASAQTAANALDYAKQQYADQQLAAERARKAADTEAWRNNMNNLYKDYAFG